MNSDNRENISYYDAFAGEYDLFFSDLDCNMEQEGACLSAVLERYDATTVLDASCGAGRQAIPLCERGFEVTAVDPSAAMLRQAETTAREHGVHLPLMKGCFADLATYFRREFDAVISLGNGLCNLATVEEIAQALRSMQACCRAGGVCLVGIKDFEALKRLGERFHPHRIVEREGTRTVLFEVWDFEDPSLISTAYLVQHPSNETSPRVRCAKTREYMLYEPELRTLALAAGFQQVRRLHHPNEALFALET